jgi:hypothetical protein
MHVKRSFQHNWFHVVLLNHRAALLPLYKDPVITQLHLPPLWCCYGHYVSLLLLLLQNVCGALRCTLLNWKG